MQDFYHENFNTLVREIKDLNKWKNIACSELLKWQFSPIDLQIQNNTNQYSSMLFYRNWLNDSRIYIKCKEPRIHKTILKKNKVRLTLPNFKTYYSNATVSRQFSTGKKTDTYKNINGIIQGESRNTHTRIYSIDLDKIAKTTE